MAAKQPGKSAPRPAAPSGNQPPAIVLTPAFKMIFITATILTVMFFLGSLYLVQLPNQTKGTERLAGGCFTASLMGFSAIIGLIGGKTL
jgi:hypothetical protein